MTRTFEPRHEPSKLGALLVKAGRDEFPKKASLDRTLAAVGVGAAAATSAVGANASAVFGSKAMGAFLTKAGIETTMLLAATKWAVIGAVGGMVTLTASTQIAKTRSPTRTENVAVQNEIGAASRRRSATVLAPTASVESGPPPDIAEARPAALPSLAHARERIPDAPGQAPIAAPGPTTLTLNPQPADPVAPPASEIALVDRAWNMMQAGQDARAVAELASYERQFPSLSLHPEVLFMRMQAARHLGDTANAEAVARLIVSTYPKSAQSARARALLAKSAAADRVPR